MSGGDRRTVFLEMIEMNRRELPAPDLINCLAESTNA